MESAEVKTARRKIAEARVADIAEAVGRIQDIVAENARWIMASMITINGGAAVAVASSNNILPLGKYSAILYFSAGIFSSLISSYCNILGGTFTIGPMVESKVHWEVFAITSDIDQEQVKNDQKRVVRRAAPWVIFAHLFGLAAASTFMLGALQIAKSIK
jgi:hypothetical protein